MPDLPSGYMVILEPPIYLSGTYFSPPPSKKRTGPPPRNLHPLKDHFTLGKTEPLSPPSPLYSGPPFLGRTGRPISHGSSIPLFLFFRGNALSRTRNTSGYGVFFSFSCAVAESRIFFFFSADTGSFSFSPFSKTVSLRDERCVSLAFPPFSMKPS